MREVALTTMQDIPGVPVRIADHLSELIIRGELAPGERIAEARITASLGVSQGSVREALHLLAQRFLVELAPRRGAIVTRMTEAHVHDLYELLIALYSSLGRLAVVRWRQEGDLVPLRNLVGQMRECTGNADALALLKLSADLTEAICRLVGNGYLTRALQDLRAVFNRGYYRVLKGGQADVRRVCDAVDEFVELIAHRDEHRIVQTVRHHGEEQRDQVLRTF